MNIKDKRVKAEIDRTIRENLVKGYIPTSNEVISEIGNYMASNNLSLPSYQFNKIYSDFPSSVLNNAKYNISNDLDIIFECAAELYQETEKQINKFESEKRKYDYRLNKLQSELLNLVNKYSSNAYTDIKIENFSDMNEFNIAQTTCDIDIRNHEATLQRLSDSIYSDISDITADFSNVGSTGITITTNGLPIDYISKSGIYWKAEVSKPTQETTEISLLLDLGKITSINKIELETPFMKPTNIIIEISTDGDRWISSDSSTIETKYISNLEGSMRYIKIRFSKDEADKFTNNNFQYIFLLDTIKLYQVEYAKTSTMISTPIKINSNINKVSIIEDAVIPPSTTISYFVALNGKNPEWVPITPLNRTNTDVNKVITFNTVDTVIEKQISVDSTVSKDEYELPHLSVNGQKIYTITPTGISSNKIIKSKLYKGTNAWRVDELITYLPDTAELGKELFLNNVKYTNTYYQNLTQYRSGQILNGKQYSANTITKYTTSIECAENGQTARGKLVAGFPVTLYLNGKQIYAGIPSKNQNVDYEFKGGINVIEAIINVNKANLEETAVVYLDLGINLEVISSYRYAEPEPMKEVSLFDLRYNTNNQKNVYSIMESNDGYEVLVKDDDLSIKYMMVYDCIIEEIDEILVSAVLKRGYDSISITPRLKQYELRII